MDHREELARLRAQMDQNIEGVKEMAKALWGFYAECASQGFDDDQAFALTVLFLNRMLGGTDE